MGKGRKVGIGLGIEGNQRNALLINEESKITGLNNFGLMTMYGDYLFDVATGWVLFDMYDELKANILERYLNLIINTLGEEVKTLFLFLFRGV
ncbi:MULTISPECIES: hypothetical protein [unclassified Paenibacillus]|uniref:hypothetical protein n=1 Tax=unclassified Paenibacillus TaxID=185978 RepID=UPI00277D7499|nr:MULTISPECIES: hypothetical protein [unclassified Paenibacillus]MDQ0899142.1 adenylate kinase [Paenibacillus sp. V4I7]MDQ0914873.1 adenylate kinase [Paenibacillus sp. V4I5]